MERLKLLIAEDDALIRELYEHSLSAHAFEIKMVSDGEEALKIYKKWHPDLIIFDSVMPVMTGFAALKEIRRVIMDKVTAVIMVTSLSRGDDVMAFIKLGICGYIVKPFDPDELASKIMGYYGKVNPDRARETLTLHDSTIKQWRDELERKADEQESHPDEFWDKGKEAPSDKPSQ